MLHVNLSHITLWWPFYYYNIKIIQNENIILWCSVYPNLMMANFKTVNIIVDNHLNIYPG